MKPTSRGIAPGPIGRCTALAIVCGILAPGMAEAQTGANVLVVANAASPRSLEIADYYAGKRQVPAEQILRLQLPLDEEIARSAYESQIERPIASWLASHTAQDRILYLVLTKDVPLRIAGSTGPNGTVASVDSELTLLYRKLAGVLIPTAGSIDNPYFLGDGAISTAKPFMHEHQDIYLVARLDGFTAADAKALIDRAAAASSPGGGVREGRILLDERSEWTQSPGNAWLEKAAAHLRALPGWSDRTVLDTGGRVLRDQANVLGYYSWGSNDPAIVTRHLHLQFVPGALAAMFVSSDARTFKEPPETWQFRDADFAGTSQSLMGDLIRDGVTGTAGHVSEPYLKGTIRPDILFAAYVSGFNLVEAFYLAMPFVSWQTIVVGDPLCAPFRQRPLSTQDIDRGIDPVTELPVFFTERRILALKGASYKPQAARLYLKAEVHLARGDTAGARKALEEATTLDDRLVGGHLMLGTLYDRASQWDAAIARYRRVLALKPHDPVALNNLAYVLAVHKHATDEALSLAKQAYTATNESPRAADTLGWVYHLLGNDVDAEPYVTAAAGEEPSSAEIQLHAAVVLAANGKGEPAARALEKALARDKTLEQREDVRQLRAKLGQ